MVVRLLVEVTKIIHRKRRAAIEGFGCETLTLKVRVKGPSRKTFKIPSGIKGKHFTIIRSCPREWSIKKGSPLILNAEETQRCMKKHAASIRKRSLKDFVIDDVNDDGFGEVSYSNEFLTAVVAPHYGARLLQLWNRHDSTDELYGGGFYGDKGYFEIGGIEETLDKQGKPRELWNATFKREKSASPRILAFSHKMKKEKGVIVHKEFSFFEELPLLLQSTALTFTPEKRRKKKGKKERKTIRLTQRIFFAMGGTPDFSNLFHIPGEEGLQTIRFNRPLFKRGWDDDIAWWQWQQCHFAPDPGLVILENEKTREALVLFFDRQKLEYLFTGDKKKTPRFQIVFKEKKLQPKRKESFHLLTCVAHGFALSKTDMLLVSKGKVRGSTIPLSFIFYTPTRRKRALLIQNGETRSEESMKKHTIHGIPGTFFSLQTAIRKDINEVSASIKEKPLNVRLNIG